MDRMSFDGSCDPNPAGRMGWSYIITFADGRIKQDHQQAPPHVANTVNVAEYRGLRDGLRAYLAGDGQGPLHITGDSQLTFGMLAVAAEAYSDQLSERMRDTRQAEARQGRHIGPVPVGYVRGPDGKLLPAPHLPDREAVQTGFQLYASGNESARTVTIKLNAAGYTWPRYDGSRAPFHKDGVIEMLQNPVYIGRVDAAGVVVDNAHEALIDRATWRECKRSFVSERRSRRSGGAPACPSPSGSKGCCRPGLLCQLRRAAVVSF